MRPYAANKYGHQKVDLYYGKRRRKKMYVHRLVLEAFTGPCPKGMECLHADDDPTNNHLTNLRWGTHSDNIIASWKSGRRGKNVGSAN